VNYDLEMEKQMKTIKEGTPLLLHACCAPCSSAVLERIGNYFKVTIFYYNPNITNKDEYDKRVNEIKKFISSFKTKYPISLEEGNYNSKDFFDISKGLEKEPERGKRCYKCYHLRLNETARIADELGYDYFCTTLTLSPHKNSNWINEIGEELNNKYNSTYLYSDFKKKNGYKRSIELSKEYNLYRQDYCGCVYSIRDKMDE
jgi:predicted adenine nucleotide alpha hydrolase (AANH) superfamily ATPase